jgi:tetratricopeptide (TPR) repeat protein
LGELISNHLRDHKQALRIYKEALNYDDSNPEVKYLDFKCYRKKNLAIFLKILMSMAKLEALNQNFDTAHNYCTAILKHAPELDEPVLVLNIISFN